MTKLVLAVHILVVCSFFDQSEAACVCTVQRNGEYCGSELNRINGNQDCARDQYLCGNSNRNGSAVVVKKCRRGFECDVSREGSGETLRNICAHICLHSTFTGNACLIDIDCHCPSGLRVDGRTRYCGNRLTGRDCNSNVVFTCGRSYPNPVDACPNGCRNGQCI